MKKQYKPTANESQLYVQRPANLDLDQLLAAIPPTFAYKRDGFLYLFDKWVDHFSWRKAKEIKKTNEYVPLSSQKLKVVLYDYQKYVDYLLKTNVWETNNQYIVGEQSKGYRFTETYSKEFVTDVISHPKLIAKILTIRQSENAEVEKLHPGLTRWFDGLAIDEQVARQLIDDLITPKLKKATKPKPREKLRLKKSVYQRSVMKIVQQEFVFKIDQRTGRLFSILTNMKKELRQALSYEGKPLVCVDLSNSQPFFSLLLFHLDFYKDTSFPNVTLNNLPAFIQAEMKPRTNRLKYKVSGERYRARVEQPTKLSVTYKGVENTPQEQARFLPMCHDTGDYEGQTRIDLNQIAAYCYHVRKGSLYQTFCDRFNAEKKSAKQTVLTILFADDNDQRPFFKSNRYKFKQLYEEVYKFFRLVKDTSKYGEDGYKFLSMLLQSIEAEVFLNRICKRVREEFPQIPLFTVHDSVCTIVNHEEYLRKVVLEEITKAVGLEPNVKLEYWGRK